MERTMNQEHLRHYLTNKPDTIALVEAVAAEGVKQFPEHVRSVLIDAGRALHQSNIDYVYEHAGSVIEKIFLNSLIVAAASRTVIGLWVTDRVSDFPERRAAWQKTMLLAREIVAHFDKNISPKSPDDFERFVDNICQDQENDAVKFGCMREAYMAWSRGWMVTPQAGFPNIIVEGKSIRVDMLIWHPSFDRGLVVECDGFEFHNSKESFVSDRKRDRAIAASGYEVQRYSGSEIFNNPRDCVTDVIAYMNRHQQPAPEVLP